MIEKAIIENAKYFTGFDHITETMVTVGITASINGGLMSVPLDLANRHYAEIMRRVEAGELTIQPAE